MHDDAPVAPSRFDGEAAPDRLHGEEGEEGSFTVAGAVFAGATGGASSTSPNA